MRPFTIPTGFSQISVEPIPLRAGVVGAVPVRWTAGRRVGFPAGIAGRTQTRRP